MSASATLEKPKSKTDAEDAVDLCEAKTEERMDEIKKEALRRSEAVKRGEMETFDGPTVMKEMREMLGDMRK